MCRASGAVRRRFLTQPREDIRITGRLLRKLPHIEGRHKKTAVKKAAVKVAPTKAAKKGTARQEGCGQKGRCEGGHGTCRSVGYRQKHPLNLGSISHSAARAVATASVYHGT